MGKLSQVYQTSRESSQKVQPNELFREEDFIEEIDPDEG